MIIKLIEKVKNKLLSDLDYARKIGVNIGSNCHISSRGFSSEPYLISIGNNVRVAHDVRFFTHGGLIPFRTKSSDLDIFGKINIGNNVHIGHGAYIMPGVKVGNNCIIGAGAVVSKSVPDGYVVGGNPAKIISKTDDFIARAKLADFQSKKMSHQEKKVYLLSNFDDERFIVKPEMTLK